MDKWATSSVPESTRRRSQRVIMSIPVSVSGTGASGPFKEETQTLVINAHGALITVSTKLPQGQTLELKCHTHPEVQTCRVVYVGPTIQGRTQLGIEFAKAVPNFWHIAFPPEDWSPPLADDASVPAKASKS